MLFSRVGLKSYLDVLDAVAWNKNCTLADIQSFTGLSRPTVVNSLKNAVQISIILEEDKKYTIVEEYDKNHTHDSKKIVVRRFLQNWSFFQQLCGFLASSNTYTAAIRKTLAFNKLDVNLSTYVENILQFGSDLGIFKYEEKEYILQDTIKYSPHETDILPASLNSEMAVIVFLSKKLTPELFHSLENPEQERLTKALLYHSPDPEKSCEYAGQALENYLRMIGINAGENLTGCDGIGQIADYLAGKARFIIHPKHRDLAKSISTIRNSSAHDRDKFTSDPWIKTADTALANILMVIQVIKSIDIWVKSQGQVI